MKKIILIIFFTLALVSCGKKGDPVYKSFYIHEINYAIT
tara:strand:- start:192 stop:308 length:117 start_codon:yes stop_codon:yes gene_type:complete